MRFGSMPRDGGNLIFTKEEAKDFLEKEPKSAKFMRPYTGAQEFLNGDMRCCLWLVNAEPNSLRDLPKVISRIEEVKKFRLASKAATTRKFAETPSLFCQIAQPDTDYLLVPRVSSERRKYIPAGFINKEVIANDQVLTVSNASSFHFGVLQSEMHMAWVKSFCGRLKSDYRYSKDVVYNNFPWPESATEKQRQAIEDAAQAVLNARALHPDSSLADLYDALTMPPELVKAHRKLDAAVDAAYSKKKFAGDSDRVAFLFELYQQIASSLEAKKTQPSKPD